MEPQRSPRALAKKQRHEILNKFLKMYINFAVTRLKNGRFKPHVLQLDYQLRRLLLGKKGQPKIVISFDILERITVSEQDESCFHIHLQEQTPVVLYSQQKGDRAKIYGEIKQLIENVQYLQGTEPLHANGQPELIKAGKVEKKGSVKFSYRTLVLTESQLICIKNVAIDAFPVNVINVNSIEWMAREKDFTMRVVTKTRTYLFRATTMEKREEWISIVNETIQKQKSAANQPKKEKVVVDDISQSTQIIALPQTLIPILGRYEINFAELHELFAAPPAINLKTYFDIRQNKIHNIRSKVQNEILSVASGMLAEDNAESTPRADSLTDSGWLRRKSLLNDIAYSISPTDLAKSDNHTTRKQRHISWSSNNVVVSSTERAIARQGKELKRRLNARKTDDGTFNSLRRMNSVPHLDSPVASKQTVLSSHRNSEQFILDQSQAPSEFTRSSTGTPSSVLSDSSEISSSSDVSSDSSFPDISSSPDTSSLSASQASPVLPTLRRRTNSLEGPSKKDLASSLSERRSKSFGEIKPSAIEEAARQWRDESETQLIDSLNEDGEKTGEFLNFEASDEESDSDSDSDSSSESESGAEVGTPESPLFTRASGEISSATICGTEEATSSCRPAWLRAQRSLDLSGGATKRKTNAISFAMKELYALKIGAVFMKYRHSKAGTRNHVYKQRFVCASANLDVICVYRHLDKTINKKRDCRRVLMNQVVDICTGFKTPTLVKYGRPGKENLAFSIFYTKPNKGDRILDLEALTQETRNLWVMCLRYILASRRTEEYS